MQGRAQQRFHPVDADGLRVYQSRDDQLTHVLMKVETHNHPTAISPFPGASTGAGGEILATDDIGGVQHPRVKVGIGADGVYGDVSTACRRDVTHQH
jgi:phosphoribosylformylglycinamidine synthase